MPFESVDHLQKMLTAEGFHYAKDAKKAAGRALGTLVEVATFYLLQAWGLEQYLAIERRLPEYKNLAITHNVEYSLHPAEPIDTLSFAPSEKPLTARKIVKRLQDAGKDFPAADVKGTQLLSSDLVLRNACVLGKDHE